MATKYIVNNVTGQTINGGLTVSGVTSIVSPPPTYLTGSTGDTKGQIAFDDYYFYDNITFYYIKVKSSKMIEQLKNHFGEKAESYTVVAIAVNKDSKKEGYDGLDRQIPKKDLAKFIKIIGIS